MHKIPLILIALVLAACSGIDYDPTKDWTAKEFYDEARKSLDAGEFQTAIKNLESLEARFPFDAYAKQAQLDIAYAYYKFDEPESAISAVERFMRLHPRDPHIDYAYYLKALVNYHRGAGLLDGIFPRDPSLHDVEVMQNAFNDFAILVKRYPQSAYAGDAHQRMIYLRNKLAQKEIDTAEYYLKYGSWLAAANRAKNVIEKYQESTWSQRALEIMITAYTNMGMSDLASDARRVLELNRHARTQQTVPATPNDDDVAELPPSASAR